MQVTREQLQKIAPNAGKKIDLYLPYINKYMDEFAINTPKRVCHYLAQVLHESNELRAVEENLNYSATRLVQVFPKYFTKVLAQAYDHKPERIANRVYANRMGNGAESTGDGWKYRGRGLIQLTGKANYRTYAGYCGYDVVSQPELIAQPLGAIRSSMWFFKTHGCNELADADNVGAVRRAINGGTNGLDKVKVYLLRAKLYIK